MRILLVSSSSGSRGGGELFLLYLAEALKKAGDEPVIWCSTDCQMDELSHLCETVCEVIRQPYTNTYHKPLRSLSHLFPCRAQTRAIAAQWSALQPTVIHINKQNLEDGLDLLAAANSLETPQLATIHITQSACELSARMGSLRDGIARNMLRHYPHPLVAVSSSRMEQLSRFLPKHPRLLLAENGVRVPDDAQLEQWRSATRKHLSLAEDCRLFLAVGRLEAQKQPLEFIDLACAIHARDPRSRFIWIGAGSLLDAFKERIRTCKAEDFISHLNWQREIYPWLAAADGYLHPAAYEGLPFSLLEAMACSLPCLVRSSLADDLGLSEHEIVYPYSRPDSKEPLSLLDPCASTRGQRAREYILANHSIDKMAQTYRAYYEDICM